MVDEACASTQFSPKVVSEKRAKYYVEVLCRCSYFKRISSCDEVSPFGVTFITDMGCAAKFSFLLCGTKNDFSPKGEIFLAATICIG
jgi:hypothetical protein